MESKDQTMVKMEDPIHSSFSSSMLYCDPVFSRNSPLGMLDEGEYYGIKSSTSLGFVELLGIQDFTITPPSTTFDDMLRQVVVPATGPTKCSTTVVQESNSEVVNTPPTPNSSSISSESSGAAAAEANDDEPSKLREENEQHQRTKKQLKLKKTSNSDKQQQGKGKGKGGKQRVARVAFMTKSEVDHLEDGYRWRKYGQKAVKNSPFPRSYYRCTSASCNVKKRVERCYNDPSIVVTTYEGQHPHPSPLLMPRPNPAAAASFFPHHLLPPVLQLNLTSTTSHQPPHFFSNNNILAAPMNINMFNCDNHLTTTASTPMNSPPPTTAASMHDLRRFRTTTPTSSSYISIGDHGLLQDIVPSILRDDDHDTYIQL
ncbi:hypothetical protein LguiB_030381 [Lonicera macranthoides]